MDMTDAPLFTDVKPGPDDGAAWWMSASDGLRLRVAAWGRDKGKNGTILMFPGRTEYVEKYAVTASEFAMRGYATIAIDWRGQGLADKMKDDVRVGHVEKFTDYQKDVAVMVRAAQSLDLPKPWFMVAHSMGGCIGLRAIHEGLPVETCAFTGPMWGINVAPHLRPLAWTLPKIAPVLGFDGMFPPGTRPESYVLAEPFEDNMLTTDQDMHQMMRDQITNHPALALGGPSYRWVGEALKECLELSRRPSPNMSCVTFLGTNERIVHLGRIHERMDAWDNGHLEMVEGAEHEVLMERPELRKRIMDQMTDHFEKAA